MKDEERRLEQCSLGFLCHFPFSYLSLRHVYFTLLLLGENFP